MGLHMKGIVAIAFGAALFAVASANATALSPANYLTGTVVAIDRGSRTVTVDNRTFKVIGFMPRQGERVFVAFVVTNAWVTSFDRVGG